ncbi:unnamed protein product [Diamesa serratosioi]
MKLSVNKDLLPVKAHYFFFMSAMGPILPQINVVGRELGISPSVMGYLMSILPIIYVLAKPFVGFLADYFSNARKFIFMSIISLMAVSFAGYIFLPFQSHPSTFDLSLSSDNIQNCKNLTMFHSTECIKLVPVECHLNDSTNNLKLNLTNINLVQVHNESYLCHSLNMTIYLNDVQQTIQCDRSEIETETPYCFYKSWVFWLFVTLTYLGTIGFNVGNCISDAICFDVLGEDQQMKYGRQRVFGTIGFGLTALVAGYAVDLYTDPMSKSHDFTPAIIVMLAFASMDLFSIKKLKLPKLSSSESIYKDVVSLFKNKRIALFLVFATIAGILDSFVIYYMFWHLEDVAEKTGFSHNIKIIEGWVIAAECLGGEIIFFLLSGKIIKKLGYVHCLSFCFLGYAIRLGLISIIPNPWYLVPIELVMQGWTYALCYTCIVAYASTIALPGTSATIQGLVAGMDDGLGFSIGSLIGGQLYQQLGGQISFRIFSGAALITCISHILLRPASIHETHSGTKGTYEEPVEQKVEHIDKEEKYLND